MKGIKICLLLLLMIGLSVALFPVGNGFITEHQMTQQAQSFIARTELLPVFMDAVQSTNEHDERCPRHDHRRQSVPQRRQSRREIAVS